MSSWQSHLPQNLDISKVVGLGMNSEELSLNPRLDQSLVHDLNQKPELPFEDENFDAVICSLSIEYLLQPVKVLQEARRILVPGGLLLITFSNRWFPPKVIHIWTELQEFERTGMVLQWLKKASGFRSLETSSLRELLRPEDDRYRKMSPFSDPIYAVWGYKK
jgi:SAM-dependent methyltransferase